MIPLRLDYTWYTSLLDRLQPYLPNPRQILHATPLLSLNSATLDTKTTASGEINVVPLPSSYTTGSAIICLSPSFRIIPLFDNAPSDLLFAIETTRDKILDTQHQFLSPTYGSEFWSDSEDRQGGCEVILSSLTLSLTPSPPLAISTEAIKPIEKRQRLESYQLSIDETGRLSASSTLGLFRGLKTFEQLWYRHKPTRDLYAPYGPYRIDDRPAFGWRAIMIDTSRHYLDVGVIKRQLEAMALVKLNVLHWHITDSTSWPLHLNAFPELSQGAYSPDEVYTEEDIKEVISYANERGIDILLEADTPGHTASLHASHSDFVACYRAPHLQNANEPPAAQLRFANDSIADFAASLFDSLAQVVSSRYVGTGGDELNVHCMMSDEATVSVLKDKGWTLDQALDEFTKKTHSALRRNGKNPTVWQEMVLDHNVSLSSDTIVHIWRAAKDAQSVLDKGYTIIHGSYEYFYLDCGIGGWIGEDGGGNTWCDPYKPWARIYSNVVAHDSFDPFANVSSSQRSQVLGGQASLWAEQVDETNLETLLWPRSAALAEVFWTEPGDGGYPLNSTSALSRMHDIRYRLVDRGIRAVPLQPKWCALNPGSCNWDS